MKPGVFDAVAPARFKPKNVEPAVVVERVTFTQSGEETPVNADTPAGSQAAVA